MRAAPGFLLLALMSSGCFEAGSLEAPTFDTEVPTRPAPVLPEPCARMEILAPGPVPVGGNTSVEATLHGCGERSTLVGFSPCDDPVDHLVVSVLVEGRAWTLDEGAAIEDPPDTCRPGDPDHVLPAGGLLTRVATWDGSVRVSGGDQRLPAGSYVVSVLAQADGRVLIGEAPVRVD